MKLLAHKSTTIVAYFPLMLPFVFLALSIIFHEVLSLKLKAQSVQFSSVQSLSRVRLFVTSWTAAHQASLSITSSWSYLTSCLLSQ